MIPGVYRNCHHVCTWSVYRSTMEDIQLDDRVGRCRTYCKRIGLSTRHSKNSHNTSQKEREVGIDLSFRYHGYHGITSRMPQVPPDYTSRSHLRLNQCSSYHVNLIVSQIHWQRYGEFMKPPNLSAKSFAVVPFYDYYGGILFNYYIHFSESAWPRSSCHIGVRIICDSHKMSK